MDVDQRLNGFPIFGGAAAGGRFGSTSGADLDPLSPKVVPILDPRSRFFIIIL
jgi:hypothetical protein